MYYNFSIFNPMTDLIHRSTQLVDYRKEYILRLMDYQSLQGGIKSFIDKI